MHPDVEVILFGDEEGAAEVCAELGLRHEPHVVRHESGVKQTDYMVSRAQEISRHKYFCFANCDIILMQDFLRAFEKARAWRQNFLFVAQRWDTDITEPIDFEDRQWSDKLRQLAETHGVQQHEYWVDLFLFSQGTVLGYASVVGGALLLGHLDDLEGAKFGGSGAGRLALRDADTPESWI